MEDREIERIAEVVGHVLATRQNDSSAQQEAAAFAKSQVSEIDSLRRELDKHYATKEYVLSTLNARVYILVGVGATVLAAVISGLFQVLFP